MKCSRCGHRANSIKGMGAHVRKRHPSALKHRKSRKVRTESSPKRGVPRASRGMRSRSDIERVIGERKEQAADARNAGASQAEGFLLAQVTALQWVIGE